MDLFLSQVVNGLGNGVVYAAVALALVLIYRTTGLLNFAQGEMALICTYFAWKLSERFPVGVAIGLSFLIGFVGGAIIERVTGRSWANFTRERVLWPLGMTTATLSIDELKQQDDVALPHVLDVMDGLKTTDFLSLGADAPAGAINASAAEMARYVQFGVGDGAPLLSQKSLSEMHTGQIAAPDFNVTGLIAAQARAVAEQPGGVPPALVTEQQYGFYWGVERFLGAKLVEHGGNVTGLTANATLLPEGRSGVVVLANADGPTPLWRSSACTSPNSCSGERVPT